MAFELWDVETNTYIGRYEDERDALAVVRTLVDHYGRDYADKLDFGTTTGEAASLEPLSGSALIDRANEVLVDHQDKESEERREVVTAARDRRASA